MINKIDNSNVIHFDFKQHSKEHPSLNVVQQENNVVDFVEFKESHSSTKEIKTAEGKDKYDVFAKLISRGMTRVVLDSTHPNVIVPDNFKNIVGLQLDWSHRFKLPDFNYDEQGVRGSLNYGGVPFFTYIPWSSVSSIANNETVSNWIIVPHTVEPK